MALSAIEYCEDQNLENGIKVVASIASLFLGPGGTIIYSSLSMTGVIDEIARQLAQEIESVKFEE